MATLYVVGTPIGNMEDITLRALKVLKDVDYIACEDTRVTKNLLNRYEINTPTISYHARSEQNKLDRIIELLEEGKNIALVSDAGTPCISDPGSILVDTARNKNINVFVIPGPSALTAAISVSGIPSSEFSFIGFLPHKKGRETIFKMIASSEAPIVFYESPHRIMKTLESLSKLDKKIVLCRELTKIFEEVMRGTTLEIFEFYKNNPEKVRGEFVCVVY